MTVLVPLSRGLSAVIDDADAEAVLSMCWHANPHRNTWSAVHSLCVRGSRKTLFLHRFLMRPPAGLWVDHINGDGLDNRRSNLRVCTRQENSRNRNANGQSRQPFKGIEPRDLRWVARINVNGRRIYCGATYATPEEAARAYDRAALEHYGEFARLNFPSGAA